MNTSPSRQFSLLETEKKDPSMAGTQHEEMQIGRFSLALHACMTPTRNDISMAITENDEGSDHENEENFNAAAEEEKKEEQPCDVSQEIMTFDVEVAENEQRIDSGRAVSDLGGLDSRRSLSEILNEGDLANVKEEELSINYRV